MKPRFFVAVDVVALSIIDRQLHVAVVQRVTAKPGRFALPGGQVDPSEDLVDAARRELLEETGIRLDPADLVQLHAYGAPGRDPRGPTVTVSFLALVPRPPAPVAGTDARVAEVRPVASVRASKRLFEFDHLRILEDALTRTKLLLEHTPAAIQFCETEFTLGELRRMYEAVWEIELDPANFRKRVLGIEGFVVATGNTIVPRGGTGRPAATYTAGPATVLDPPLRIHSASD